LTTSIYNLQYDCLAILIYGSPEIMLFAIDLHIDFINVEGAAETSVLSFQPPSE